MEKITVQGDDITGVNKAYILGNAMTKVVNARNAKDLSGKPFRMFLDLAELVVFPMKLGDIQGEEAWGIVTVDNIIIERYGLDEDELFETARQNTGRRARIRAFGEFLPAVPPDSDLFLVTNDECLYGAGVLCSHDALQRLREHVGSDVYIIPSSIHEVLFCRRTGGMKDEDMKWLTSMIGEMNQSVVKADEVLSDHLYAFDEDGKLYIAG